MRYFRHPDIPDDQRCINCDLAMIEHGWIDTLESPDGFRVCPGDWIITGVKNGWLPAKTYGPAARKAWLGLVKHIDENANVTDVCEGTNKGFTVQYYLDRKRLTGDLHGQAAALWSSMALLR